MMLTLFTKLQRSFTMAAYKHKRIGKCMDSHKDNSSDESTPDTSHLGSAKRSNKSSRTKIVGILVVVVVVVVAAVAGGLYYKKTQDDKKAADAAAAAAAEKNKKPSQEEQMTATLTDNVKKQIEALKQDDGKAAIETSTAAAQKVGRDLNEADLKE